MCHESVSPRVLVWLVEQPAPRLDRHVAEACPELSRSQVRRLIDTGAITVNNAPAKAAQKLIPGDYAVRGGEIANPSAADEPEHRYPRFLEQVSPLGSRPQRYRLRPGYVVP